MPCAWEGVFSLLLIRGYWPRNTAAAELKDAKMRESQADMCNSRRSRSNIQRSIAAQGSVLVSVPIDRTSLAVWIVVASHALAATVCKLGKFRRMQFPWWPLPGARDVQGMLQCRNRPCCAHTKHVQDGRFFGCISLPACCPVVWATEMVRFPAQKIVLNPRSTIWAAEHLAQPRITHSAECQEKGVDLPFEPVL